jgi:NTE family protein
MAKALVLGGGSLKGAWQVGAIQAILETGFKPDMIYGISAGALNAAFMVNEIGRQFADEESINWDLVNKQLLRFWLENITKPADIGILRSKITLGLDTMLSRFDGLLDTSPLHNKVKAGLDLGFIRKSPVWVKVGTVNVNSGEIFYADPSEEYFIDYVLASSALPFIMPAVQIGGDHRQAFMDGGLREVVPLRKAIEDGADEIYCIATHPKNRPLETFNYRSFFSLIERIKDITVNQFENSDIEWAENYDHDLMGFGAFSLKKKLKLTVIRPDEPLQLELTDFDSNGIRELIKQGYEKAYLQLQSP